MNGSFKSKQLKSRSLFKSILFIHISMFSTFVLSMVIWISQYWIVMSYSCYYISENWWHRDIFWALSLYSFTRFHGSSHSVSYIPFNSALKLVLLKSCFFYVLREKTTLLWTLWISLLKCHVITIDYKWWLSLISRWIFCFRTILAQISRCAHSMPSIIFQSLSSATTWPPVRTKPS